MSKDDDYAYRKRYVYVDKKREYKKRELEKIEKFMRHIEFNLEGLATLGVKAHVHPGKGFDEWRKKL